MTLMPLVNSGDAVFHVANFSEDMDKVEEHVDLYEEQLGDTDTVRFIN